MRGPKPPQVALRDEARRALEAVVRGRQTAQQVALRARIILAAADGENTSQLARRLGIEPDTARLWRTRWLALAPLPLAALGVAARLADAPRPGGLRLGGDKPRFEAAALTGGAPGGAAASSPMDDISLCSTAHRAAPL